MESVAKKSNKNIKRFFSYKQNCEYITHALICYETRMRRVIMLCYEYVMWRDKYCRRYFFSVYCLLIVITLITQDLASINFREERDFAGISRFDVIARNVAAEWR